MSRDPLQRPRGEDMGRAQATRTRVEERVAEAALQDTNNEQILRITSHVGLRKCCSLLHTNKHAIP